MKPAPFDYRRPSTVAEAVGLLAELPGLARPLAGGQSLVPMLNLRLAPIDRLVDLGGISALREVREEPGRIRYGAMTRHVDFEDGRVPDAANGLLRQAGGQIAYRAVRNRGTVGGAIALSDPAADWLPTMAALEATLTVAGPDGEREIALADFVLGPYMTALGESDLLVSVNVPKLPAGAVWGYAKVTRKTGEYADAMAIAVIDRPRKRARLAAGAAGGAPLILSRAAEAVLRGERGSALRAIAIEELAASGREHPAYELRLHAVTAVRALEDALSK